MDIKGCFVKGAVMKPADAPAISDAAAESFILSDKLMISKNKK